MASYNDLRGLFADDTLRNRVEVATIIAAQTLIDGPTPTSSEIAWAQRVFANPRQWSERVLLYVLASNSSSTIAQITNASDALVQNNVDNAIQALSTGFVPGEPGA